MLHWLVAVTVLAAEPAQVDAPASTPSSAAVEAEASTDTPKPVTLACSGSYTPSAEPFADQNLVQSRSITFEVIVDFQNKTVLVDGSPRVVREISDDAIIYSPMKAGVLSALLSMPVTTISRKTGVYRNQYGNGKCEVRETKNLF